MNGITGVLIYLGIGAFVGAVALAILRRRTSDLMDEAENTIAAVGIGVLWPVSIVVGVVTVAVIAMSHAVSSWIEARWPSRTPAKSDRRP